MKHLLTHISNLVKKDVKTMEDEPESLDPKARKNMKFLPGIIRAAHTLDEKGFKKELSNETGVLQKILTSVSRFFGNIGFDKDKLLREIRWEVSRHIHDQPKSTSSKAHLDNWSTKESLELEEKAKKRAESGRVQRREHLSEEELLKRMEL